MIVNEVVKAKNKLRKKRGSAIPADRNGSNVKTTRITALQLTNDAIVVVIMYLFMRRLSQEICA